jgi:UDP-N-acetyl-D-glucosamine/UDP-N-acetyl-D-galactosamine dehydrogenase
MITSKKTNIAILGLGYVGLPLAIEFGKFFNTIGFDTNKSRIDELKAGNDSSHEVEPNQFHDASLLSFSNDSNDINKCNIFIVTVPTPISEDKSPNLKPLISASKIIGGVLKKDDIVIYESTVYPGTTEDVCVPILEQYSDLEFNKDFYCGYSPERINPGDKLHPITSIKKITSGSTKKTADKVDLLYQKIITAGTHKVDKIRIAEAAKVIENTQRDINISLINEIALICNKLDIDTEAVLEAAGTKWNFLPFRPGLVGGHCIGVDPYYLAHKSIEVGYYPEIILAGRRVNENMSNHIVQQVCALMVKKNINIAGSNVLIMGITFKENCSDMRNSGVINIVKQLEILSCNVEVYDPWCDKEFAKEELNISTIIEPISGKYDSIILAVAHDIFKDFSIDKIREYGKQNHVVYDVKYLFDKVQSDGRL